METRSMSRKSRRDEVTRAARPQSLFELLSDEDLRNVVRHLSGKPGHKKWGNYVFCENAMTLLRLGGRVAAAFFFNWTVSLIDRSVLCLEQSAGT